MSPAAPGSTASYDAEAATLPPPPGAEWATPEAEPEEVGGYRLLRPLGSGGMGRVYEAEDSASGRRVAVKLIGAGLSSGDAVERFRQEGRLASAIAHPRCVFVLAADEDAGRPYIVMELMEGSTLKDLVEKHGPLPPGEAVLKILDVIEGLQAAHRLGVIHRDVKPSNCFLEEDGRVKVGDFGLAKSMGGDSHLTRTGAFLGTPLFASPEQIRRDPLDEQTDVYSVAATLYYLLVGKAPFEVGDATATMARIVSEPPPSARAAHPAVPASMDRVVRRGLERQRDRRWRDLEAFRQALLPFVPAEVAPAGPGIRIAAYVIDYAPWWVCAQVSATGAYLAKGAASGPAAAVAAAAVWKLAFLAYFVVLEAIWGCSLGKRLLRLRVSTPGDARPPGCGRAFLRALVFFVLFEWGGAVGAAWAGEGHAGGSGSGLSLLGWILLACTMRARNGYRGLHEFASGTCTLRLPWPETSGQRRRQAVVVSPRPLPAPEGLAERIGPYAVEGAVRWDGEVRLLAARDESLNRAVWIHLRPVTDTELPAERRRLSRATRLRWLTSGRLGGDRWDAFLAPSGVPLTEAVRAGGRLNWAEARPIIRDLADELVAALQEDTVPAALGAAHVWVRSDGQVQIVDWAAEGAVAVAHTPEQRSLVCLGETVVVLLEGRPRPPDMPATPLRAPLPEYAALILNPLVAERPPGTSVARLREQLAATRDRPRDVNRALRSAQLVLLAVCLALPLLIMFAAPLILANAIMVERSFDADRAETLLSSLEADTARLERAAAHEPLPEARLSARAAFERDRQLAARLRARLARVQAFVAALRRANGVVGSAVTYAVERAARQEHARTDNASESRKLAARMTRAPGEPLFSARDLTEVGLLIVAACPAVWVVWAFLTRGGLTLRLMGVSVLRGNGRKAWRIQCAWRALLAWAPLVALLSLSVWLLMSYWAGWNEADGRAWMFWLAWACWTAALALLPIYVFLALRSPGRSLLERLSGTYLVPR